MISNKICSKCELEKDISKDFYIDKKGNLSKICLKCKEAISEINKKWYLNKNEEIKIRRKEFRDKHKEELAQVSREYRKNNKDKVKESRARYYQNKKKELLINEEKLLMYKLRRNFSTLFRTALKSNNLNKQYSFLKYVSYTLEELKANIESKFEEWQNWNNWGVYNPETYDINRTWQLDHIIPQKDLPYSSFDDDNFKICWSLDNLRPLDSKENIIDGATRKRHKK